MTNTRMDSMADSVEGSMLKLRKEVTTLKEEMQKMSAMERGIQNLTLKHEQLLQLQEQISRELAPQGSQRSTPSMGPMESGEASSGPTREIPPTLILHPANPPGNHFDIRPRKLKLPTFDSDNPEGWILKAKRFFALN